MKQRETLIKIKMDLSQICCCCCFRTSVLKDKSRPVTDYCHITCKYRGNAHDELK